MSPNLLDLHVQSLLYDPYSYAVIPGRGSGDLDLLYSFTIMLGVYVEEERTALLLGYDVGRAGLRLVQVGRDIC